MIRGERFELDLGSDNESDAAPKGPMPAVFVADILERRPSATQPPRMPTLKSKTGFPEHNKILKESRWKQQQDTRSDWPDHESQNSSENVTSSSSKMTSWEDQEKVRINQENQRKLDAMTPSEIEEERQELMNSLSPAFIQRLLQRTNKHSGEKMQQILQQSSIDSGSNEADLTRNDSDLEHRDSITKSQPGADNVREKKTVSFETPEPTDIPANPPIPPTTHTHGDETKLPHDSVHFPRPPQPPPLDPASETFLEDLHTKYFPSLPADPDKLEWMQTATNPNTYDPDAAGLSPEQIRFSFTGELIPPRTAAEIPVTAGLHHHGDAPDSAGYTIPELAHLARSTYPAQRCIAFQTLGRFLYRLGKGEFGNAGDTAAVSEDQEALSELAKELWGVVERERVIELLVTESEGQGIDKGRHLSAKAYATEAVWLWQKGGGRRWKAS